MPNPYIVIDGKEYAILRYMGAGQIMLRPVTFHDKRTQRIEWAQDIMAKVNQDEVLFVHNGAFAYALNKRSERFGTSRCMPSDENIAIIGKAVAYSNLMGWSVPEYI